MQKYIEKYLKEKGIIVASDLSALNNIDAAKAKKIKRAIALLELINASDSIITQYLDNIMKYAESLKKERRLWPIKNQIIYEQDL